MLEVEYFVRGFLIEMELVMDKIKPFLYLKKATNKKIVLSSNEIQILDFFNEMNSITSKDIEASLLVSRRTAQRYLAQLLKKKLINKKGSKKNAIIFYSWSSLIVQHYWGGPIAGRKVILKKNGF